MLVVIAVGGKNLLEPVEGPAPGSLRAGIRVAAAAVAEVARHHQVVLTHGGSPQVGLFAYRSALAQRSVEHSLDLVGAEAEGFLGYQLQQELENELRDREVVTLLTQVQVDPDAAGFGCRRKLVGPVLAPVDAERLSRERGWAFEPVEKGLRRAVPSPEPLAVVELRTIERLASEGVLVICGGGGGIPVRCDADGSLQGVEAVIDKDRTAALLATLLGADVLLYLTDVPAVADHWGSAFVRPLELATPRQLRSCRFDDDTMGLKVESACRFVEQTGRRAVIGALVDANALCAGTAGTQIVASELAGDDLSAVPGGAAR
jgi:carbamate kinase